MCFWTEETLRFVSSLTALKSTRGAGVDGLNGGGTIIGEQWKAQHGESIRQSKCSHSAWTSEKKISLMHDASNKKWNLDKLEGKVENF